MKLEESKMKKTLCLLFAIIVTMTSLSACSSRSEPAGVTDANNLSGGGQQSKTYAVTNNPDFKSEMAAGPHQGILGQRSFFFAFNQYDLDSKYYPVVEAHANYLLDHPKQCVLLAGNTDERGSGKYNLALGQKRADTVAHQLEEDGVARSQIRAISYGKERPVTLEHTEAAYAENRRTDLIYENCESWY